MTKEHTGPSSLSSPLMQFTCASWSAPARGPHENVQSRMEFCLCIQFHGRGTRSAGDLFQGWQRPLAMKCVVAGDGVRTAQSRLGRSRGGGGAGERGGARGGQSFYSCGSRSCSSAMGGAWCVQPASSSPWGSWGPGTGLGSALSHGGNQVSFGERRTVWLDLVHTVSADGVRFCLVSEPRTRRVPGNTYKSAGAGGCADFPQ